MAKANGKRVVRVAGKVSGGAECGDAPIIAKCDIVADDALSFAHSRSDGGLASCESKGARAQSCCCHHKATPRSEEFQRDLQKRLNRAIGQLNGVKAMIDDNRYCGDVLTQLAAAESAVHSISAILLQNHLETCVVEQIEAGNTAIIDEAMQLIKKFAR